MSSVWIVGWFRVFCSVELLWVFFLFLFEEVVFGLGGVVECRLGRVSSMMSLMGMVLMSMYSVRVWKVKCERICLLLCYGILGLGLGGGWGWGGCRFILLC